MAVADPFGLTGQIIDGQLRVGEAIGEGGFSIVYKGEHIGLGEPVAIKCLKLPRKLEPKLVDAFGKRFRDEGRLLYRLSQGSLYIARSITSGTCIAPTTGMLVPYMALEWLDGHSLVTEFKERRARGRMPLSLDEAVKLFEPAVQALAYAHSQGVVHRDVKPGNLIYTQTREGAKLKVLDFGLAKIFNDEAIGMQPSVQTQGNFFMCSPSYGAPEQFDPKLGQVGPWTDVYAMALVFTESLADRKARHAESMAEGALLALNPATKPTPRTIGVRVPDAVEAVIARAVAMRPQDRWASCGEFWSALKEAVRAAPRDESELARTVMDPAAVEAARAHVFAAEAARERDTEAPPQTARMASAAGPVGTMSSNPPREGLMSTVRMDSSTRGQWAQAREQLRMGSAPTALAIPAAPIGTPPQQPAYAPPRPPVPSFDEASSGLPRTSRAPLYVAVALLIVALMAAAAWGGYVLVKHRAAATMPPVGARSIDEAVGCPSSPT
jgi:serine/threonine-protein kinase